MASARYNLVAAKSKWEEQAFFFDDALLNYGLEQFLHNHLRELGWFQFGRKPQGPTSIGFWNFTPTTPTEKTSQWSGAEEFQPRQRSLTNYLICQMTPQASTKCWRASKKKITSRQSLIPEAKLWNTFVKRNLLPTSHNQTVDRTRMLLINTIMTGFRVNVGEILANELAALYKSDKGILAFPCLVSALCRQVNTPMFDTDKYQAEKTGWTRAVYMRKMNVADAEPLNMAMPTPPASPVNEADARVGDSAPPSPAEPSVAAEQHRTPPPSPPVIPVPSHTTTTSPATTPAAPAEQTRGRTT
ncbi:hypothetical protein V6N11_063115 [Hibiscus sabdariffa]|uniref:Putative plant transposon protein domain-containing protein n=1 Tax=Hibiscus sabdariffa TaxID=183260 RepID=A0ABR2NEL3_9ROSI